MNVLDLDFVPNLQTPDKEIWETLNYAPENVTFPVFDAAGRVAVLENVKAAVKERLLKSKLGKLDVRWSGKTKRDKGLLVVRDFNGDYKQKESKHEVATAMEVESDLTDLHMELYFNEAAETAKEGPKATPRGIPHDYDKGRGIYKDKGQGFAANVWLPGVFLIDEIFKALLCTVDKKIKAANKAIAELKKQKEEADQQGAQHNGKVTDLPAFRVLERFIDDFSKPGNGPSDNKEVDQYRAFINYKSELPTYIKLVRVGEFIMAAIVHVGDWAAGYHSSGSAIHS